MKVVHIGNLTILWVVLIEEIYFERALFFAISIYDFNYLLKFVFINSFLLTG